MVRPAFGSCQLTTTTVTDNDKKVRSVRITGRCPRRSVMVKDYIWIIKTLTEWLFTYLLTRWISQKWPLTCPYKSMYQKLLLCFLVFKIKLRLIQNKCFVCNIATETFHCSVNGKVQKKREDYIDWREYFMAMAFLAAKRSKDPSSQVGACVVNKENKIVGIG